VLLLSDGAPNSKTQRDACHNAAKAAQIPIFTVGLGPAAEGAKSVSQDAVKVLRELASMGTALARGSCKTTAHITDAATKIQPGMKVTGEVTIGTNGAKGTFEFVAPEKALPTK